MNVVTRFAPSPTGFMHVGGVRTALFAWLVARQAGGKFILRIEDTDRSRHVEESEQHIMDSLRWLGLDWGEGPVRQSERLAIYREWAQKLIDAGRAYADPYSEAELEELRQKAKAAKKPFLYRGSRPQDPPAWDGSQPLRFKSEPKDYQWQDAIMGPLNAGAEAIDDFILIKSDGFPTYNFAHIVDDSLMDVTHVIRSQEFLPSVPRFLNLYEALGIKPPTLATVPFVLGPDGKKKLGKRDGAKDILDYRQDGYLPEAMINLMATLGWNDGSEQEVFSIEELIKKFSLERVQKSGARFDEQRLLWLNSQHIAKLSDEELLKRISQGSFWPASADEYDDEYKLKIVGLIKLRLRTLLDTPRLSIMFFEDPKPAAVSQLMEASAIDKTTRHKMLQAAADSLSDSSFDASDIASRLNQLLTELGTKPAILFSLIRIAISGQPYSPDLFESLAILGKEKSLVRLKQAIA